MNDLLQYIIDFLKSIIDFLKQQTEQMKQQEQQQRQAQQQAQAEQNILQLQYELFLLLSKISAPNYLNPLKFKDDLAPRGYKDGVYRFAWSKTNLNIIQSIILHRLKNNLNNHITICKKRVFNDLYNYPDLQYDFPILIQKGIYIVSIQENSDEILLGVSI